MTDWHDFCDRLRDLGDGIIDMPGVRTEQDLIDGYKHLLQLLAGAITESVSHADHAAPSIYRYNHDAAQWGAPNTDNTYWRAKIDPTGTYRLTGRVQDGRPFLVQLPQGEMHLDQYGSAGEVTSDDLDIADDGSFALIIGGEPRDGNWLRINGDCDHVSIREYFLDWSVEPGWFAIERIDASARVAERRQPTSFANDVETMITWTEAAFTYWPKWIQTRRQHAAINKASEPMSVPGGADNIAYGGIQFDLADDEVLIIDLEEPVARYWSFALYDMLWYESPMFGQRLTSLNNAQVEIVNDACRIIVSHQDPGWANWIDTTGLRLGSVAYRYVWAEAKPVPEVRVARFADIAVPGDPDHRSRQLADRAIATQRRFR